MDIQYISEQARHIHDYFQSLFYIFATLLLVIGILVEYGKMPLGGVPGFGQLLGRTIIAILLLVSYPEISNFITLVGDQIASEIGNMNNWTELLQKSSETFKDFSWSWTSVGDTLIWIISFLAYGLLYLTVFFFDAAIAFCIILLYTFSPVLIVFFILPQTAAMTSGLFKTLCEVVCWKIVWSVLGTLLWSTAIRSFEPGNNLNFITQLALVLILTLSVLYTPVMVKGMLSGGLTQALGQMAGDAMSGLSGGYLSRGAIQKAAGTPVRMPVNYAKNSFKKFRSRKSREKHRKPPPSAKGKT